MAPRIDPDRLALATGELRVGQVVDAVREAERRGFEAAHIGEAGVEADAFVAAAAALGATVAIRVGPGIANVADRHPVALARGAATLDRLAPGRALLGIGLGDPAAVTAVLGGRPAPRLAGLEDAARICRSLLAGRRADHDGTVYSAHAGPPPARAAPGAPVPLLLAAVGERTLRLAGRLADGVILNYGATARYVRWAVERVAEGAEQAGRDPAEVDVFGHVLVAVDGVPGAGAQLRRVAATLRSVLDTPGQGGALAAAGGGRPASWDAGGIAGFAAVGDRAACLAHLERLREAGLRCPVLLPSAMRGLDLHARRDAEPALLE